MITVIDYRMGNLGSIANMFRRLGVKARVSSRPEEIKDAERLLLPGVGHFSNGTVQLEASGLREVLDEVVLRKGTPILGICVGQQLLTNGSQEGPGHGLNWIPGECIKFTPPDGSKVPHMGWNYVRQAKDHPILANLGNEPRFYFAHSFFVETRDRKDVLLESMYGGQRFTVGIAKNNVIGLQFHPEKSHRFGMKVLENFSKWKP